MIHLTKLPSEGQPPSLLTVKKTEHFRLLEKAVLALIRPLRQEDFISRQNILPSLARVEASYLLNPRRKREGAQKKTRKRPPRNGYMNR